MNNFIRADEQTALVSFHGLDELWFQVAGTRCNLECTHCFISCSPHNHSFGFLSLETVEQVLAESVEWGVKEYYFTGGEPFLNPDLITMLERTLHYGPASVLTNATVLKDEWLTRLKTAEERSLYSLEFRVSIDGPSAETNDPIRGEGTFDRAMRGVDLLVGHGFLPILTMTRVWDDGGDEQVLKEFRRVLRARGYVHPRIKLLPRLKIGAESRRTAGYDVDERITPDMMRGFDETQLICSRSRVITDRGVWVCPILLDEPAARMGDSLSDSFRSFSVRHGACFTCWQFGAICTNPSAAGRGA
jgi:sulfatase maturation enzyme AslB (radical SAM superfamily)